MPEPVAKASGLLLRSSTGLGDDNFLEFTDASASPVSAANRARFRFNLAASRFEQSINGGAWAAFGGGGFLAQQIAFVDAANGNDGTGAFGTLLAFKTIQAAINAVPAYTTPANQRTWWGILVAPGTYDEALSVDISNRKIAILGLGPFNLGTFDASAWGPSGVPRSITVLSNTSNVDGHRHSFMLGSILPLAEGLTTHPAYMGVPRISGQIIFNDAAIPGGTTADAYLMCNVFDLGATGRSVDGSAKTGGLNVYLHKSRFLTAWFAASSRIQKAEVCNFVGLVTCTTYSSIRDCQFSGGMTVTSATPDLQPSGMVGTNFAGTFTGPANSLRLDGTTNYWFVTNAAVLAGGATKVILDNTGAFSRFVWLPQGSTYTQIQDALNSANYDGVFLEPGPAAYSITANLTIPNGKFLCGGGMTPNPAGTRAILTLTSGFSILAQAGSLSYCNVVWTAGSLVNAIIGTSATCKYVNVSTSAGTTVLYAFSGGFNKIYRCSVVGMSGVQVSSNPTTNYFWTQIEDLYLSHSAPGVGSYGVDIGAGIDAIRIKGLRSSGIDYVIWSPSGANRLKVEQCTAAIATWGVIVFGGNDPSFSEIFIDGCAIGFSASGLVGGEIHKITVNAPTDTGFRLLNPNNLKVTDVLVTSATGQRPIYLFNPSGCTVSNLRTHVHVYAPGGGDGILVTGGTFGTYTGLSCKAQSGSALNNGVRITNHISGSFAALEADYNLNGQGVVLDQLSECSVASVSANNNGTQGIVVSSCVNSCSFSALTSTYNGSNGIRITGNTGCAFSALGANFNGGAGILEDTNSRCTFSNVIVERNLDGVDAGTGSLYCQWVGVSANLHAALAPNGNGIILRNAGAVCKMQETTSISNTVNYSFGTGWQVEKGQEKVQQTITVAASPYSALLADEVILVNAAGGPVAVVLPQASLVDGKNYVVKKIDASANAVSISAAGGVLIDGITPQVINVQWAALRFMSDGTVYYLI